MKISRTVTCVASCLALCLVLVGLYLLWFPSINTNRNPIYARSQSIAGMIAFAIQDYVADYAAPPTADQSLSRVLFGRNSKEKIYLHAAQFPTNQWGYFVDAENQPYEITITTDSVVVIGMRGRVKVEKPLEGEESKDSRTK
jgi:hypothetical protein